tara:strand:+ start:4038 stop:4253 length:216 start_codon:yes stop_codon:yes gene_type:complete
MTQKVFADINGNRVELLGEELENWKKQAAIEESYAKTKLELEAKAETDRIAAQNKLAALGLTPDDLKALGL